MADDNEELPAEEDLPETEENLEQLSMNSPPERSGHVAVTDGKCMFVWGGYKVRVLVICKLVQSLLHADTEIHFKCIYFLSLILNCFHLLKLSHHFVCLHLISIPIILSWLKNYKLYFDMLR